MKLSDEPALAVLNALLAVCTDSQQGYENAAADITDPELARVFNGYAEQRIKFADELHDRIRTLRREPDMSGTVGGDVHRAWMDVKAAMASAQHHAVLVECERADALAAKAYGAALQTRDLDEDTRRLIQRQYEAVQAAHDRVRQLRDSATYAHR
ncbi:MAG: PA2169 family four-helix-bundle protein [Opitutaceae bacterium]|nr:PA2169 family four-helix-bundle protein [Opitutaceae bacterium]